MPNFGRYRSLQELSRSGLMCVYLAESDDKPGANFIVKQLSPPADFLTEEMLRLSTWAFVESAAGQRRVADKSAHWAKVLDVGTTDSGAFYVVDQYASSAEKLIRGRIKVSAMQLH